MTMPRKHSRFITVNGERYKWRLRYEPFYESGGMSDTLNLTIESVNVSQFRIYAAFKTRPVWPSDSEFAITPRVVRQVIEHTLPNGLTPEAVSQDFVIENAERFVTAML